jgi:DNA-directed RNA polymerase specialized sigma24 family protein
MFATSRTDASPPRLEEIAGLLGFARRLAEIKGADLAARFGGDIKDHAQDLMAEILVRWPGYRAARGRPEAFIETVVRTAALKMIRHRRAKRRAGSFTVVGGDVPDRAYCDRADRCSDLQMDVESAVSRLPPDDQDLCSRLSSAGVAEVARDLGVPYSTLVDRIGRVRALFAREGLDHYIRNYP